MPRPIGTLAATSRYIRSFRKLPRPIQDRLISRERLFRRDSTDPRLRTHKLTGPLKSLWSWSVDYEYRVLFEYLGPDSVLLHDVGTHSIYR